MSDTVLVEPLAEPVHLDEAKAHLRMTNTAEDPLIKRQIRAARRYVEAYCSRALVRQQRQLVVDCFPECYPWVLELPYGPVRAVQSIEYVDTDGVTQTLDPSLYRVDVASGLARLTPAYGESWPSTQDVTGAVTVKYTAGHVVPIASFDATGDAVTAKGHDLAADAPVRLSNSGGVIQSGLSLDENYYVKSPTADTLQVSLTSGGAAVDITSTTAGTGQSFVGVVPDDMISAILILIHELFEQRGETITGTLVQQVKRSIDDLLSPHRLIRF